MQNVRNVKLIDVCTLSFGAYVKSLRDEGVLYLQVKNFSDVGDYLDNIDTYVLLGDLKESSLLEQDDILFVSKGNKFFAYKYDGAIGKAVASSIFYVIKVDRSIVLPEYLLCVLNHPKSLSYFYSASAGSSIPSIRKKELLDFEIPLITIEEQKKIVDVFQCHKNQMNILEEIKERKQILFNQIFNQLTEI
ncbi:MAG: restriction endonuclease subunit [Chryseobacterium sp.]|jgi:restriction endonuclease S subunit|nr:restriction endonuclease subunit [Chryseobacterium sp.]